MKYRDHTGFWDTHRLGNSLVCKVNVTSGWSDFVFDDLDSMLVYMAATGR